MSVVFQTFDQGKALAYAQRLVDVGTGVVRMSGAVSVWHGWTEYLIRRTGVTS